MHSATAFIIMPIIQLSTPIAAPPEREFDLARSIDAHQQSAEGTLAVSHCRRDKRLDRHGRPSDLERPAFRNQTQS